MGEWDNTRLPEWITFTVEATSIALACFSIHHGGMVILLLNLSVTSALMGLIWLVQVVHYPSFRYVSETDFRGFSLFHTTQITWVVAPLMGLELLLALRLPFEASVNLWTAWGALGLLFVIWLSTAFVQVPLHGKLAAGKDALTIERLVRTNWLRTLAWSLKAGLLGWEVFRHY